MILYTNLYFYTLATIIPLQFDQQTKEIDDQRFTQHIKHRLYDFTEIFANLGVFTETGRKQKRGFNSRSEHGYGPRLSAFSSTEAREK
jgi:hypothetical protein